VAKAKGRLWLHTRQDRHRWFKKTGPIKYNCLWHQGKVWRAFSTERHWKSPN